MGITKYSRGDGQIHVYIICGIIDIYNTHGFTEMIYRGVCRYVRTWSAGIRGVWGHMPPPPPSPPKGKFEFIGYIRLY